RLVLAHLEQSVDQLARRALGGRLLRLQRGPLRVEASDERQLLRSRRLLVAWPVLGVRPAVGLSGRRARELNAWQLVTQAVAGLDLSGGGVCAVAVAAADGAGGRCHVFIVTQLPGGCPAPRLVKFGPW